MTKQIKLALWTLILIIAAHHLMVLLHEWSHATVGYFLGLKKSPFDIFYGDWTLFHAEEDIDYDRILNSEQPWKSSLISGAALLMNVLLFMIAKYSFSIQQHRKNIWLTLAWYWFAVFNIAELYSYLPLRALSESGDVGHFVNGLAISPWIVLILFSPLVFYHIYVLLTKDLSGIFENLLPRYTVLKTCYIILSVALIFGLYDSAPVFYYGPSDPKARWSIFSCILWIGVTFWLLIKNRNQKTAGT